MSYKPFTTEYTYQIIDDIKEYLEETNKDQTTLDTLDLCHLIGETDRLNNIINKIEEHFVFLKMNSTGGNKEFFEDILDFIKALRELKGDDK